MFCMNCGSKVDEGNVFCMNCGTAVGTGQDAAVAAPVPDAPVLGNARPAPGTDAIPALEGGNQPFAQPTQQTQPLPDPGYAQPAQPTQPLPDPGFAQPAQQTQPLPDPGYDQPAQLSQPTQPLPVGEGAQGGFWEPPTFDQGPALGSQAAFTPLQPASAQNKGGKKAAVFALCAVLLLALGGGAAWAFLWGPFAPAPGFEGAEGSLADGGKEKETPPPATGMSENDAAAMADKLLAGLGATEDEHQRLTDALADGSFKLEDVKEGTGEAAKVGDLVIYTWKGVTYDEKGKVLNEDERDDQSMVIGSRKQALEGMLPQLNEEEAAFLQQSSLNGEIVMLGIKPGGEREVTFPLSIFPEAAQPLFRDASGTQISYIVYTVKAISVGKPSNGKEPAADHAGSDFIFEDSGSRYLSGEEVRALSDWDRYIARNEIFARHGRGFKNEDLRSYFTGKAWYSQVYTPEEFDAIASSVLNDYEDKNSLLIRTIEEELKSPYLG
ncbi:MAG: YARHG domain-containing protein [Coriobacteriaceae bacterium]|jgi:hypothetical protein|nr:YARHG domain-containing protein [Coriobacteriaceae bacterium]